MERRFYRELWSIRFNKMLELEEKSVINYQALHEESKKRFQGHAVAEHLERLIADEKRHALLVRELIQILEKQPE